jgi:hypothetical protein
MLIRGFGVDRNQHRKCRLEAKRFTTSPDGISNVLFMKLFTDQIALYPGAACEFQ